MVTTSYKLDIMKHTLFINQSRAVYFLDIFMMHNIVQKVVPEVSILKGTTKYVIMKKPART